MTTTINASTSAGLVQTADTSGVLALQTAGTTAVTVDASQNVGIGTASPNKKLEVLSVGEIIRATSNTGGNDQNISIKSNSGTADCSTNIFFADRYAASSYASSYIRGTASGTSPLIFATGGTNFTNIYDAGAPVERMRVNAGAPILCLAGGNTSATGTGIAFPATQSASTDANTLDDYEEGTWSAVVTAESGSITTYAIDSATYTKTGNTVYVYVRFNVTNKGTGSNFVVSGLPFTAARELLGIWSETNLTGLTGFMFNAGTGGTSFTSRLASNWAGQCLVNGNYTVQVTYRV